MANEFTIIKLCQDARGVSKITSKLKSSFYVYPVKLAARLLTRSPESPRGGKLENTLLVLLAADSTRAYSYGGHARFAGGWTAMQIRRAYDATPEHLPVNCWGGVVPCHMGSGICRRCNPVLVPVPVLLGADCRGSAWIT